MPAISAPWRNAVGGWPTPAQGRACDDVRPGYLSAEQGRHVVFFRKDERGTLIARILHARMLPERHLSDQDETDA